MPLDIGQRPVSDMSKSASMRAAVCEAYREASRTPTCVAARIEKASADNLIITSRCRFDFFQSLKLFVMPQMEPDKSGLTAEARLHQDSPSEHWHIPAGKDASIDKHDK